MTTRSKRLGVQKTADFVWYHKEIINFVVGIFKCINFTKAGPLPHMSWDFHWSLHPLRSAVHLFHRRETATPIGVTPSCTHQHTHQSNPCYHKTGLSDFSLQAGKKYFSKICSLLGISKNAVATTSALITFNPVMLSKQMCIVIPAPQCSSLSLGTHKLICIIVGVCCHRDDVPSCGSCWGVLKLFWLRGSCPAPGWPLNLQTTGRPTWRNTSPSARW